MSGFATISAKNRELDGGYVTIGGKWRKITDGWAVKNGVWQQIFSSGLPLANLPVGTLIRLKENGYDAYYRIIHQGLPSSLYDASCNGTWVMREPLYGTVIWHNPAESKYTSSIIHVWLNNDFLGFFDSNTQGIIKQVKIPYAVGGGNNLVISGENGLSTKIFLLSIQEVGISLSPFDGACLSYFSGFSETDSRRIAYHNGTATAWWLRTPYNATQSRTITTSGGASYARVTGFNGCRPAMVLDNTVMANSTPNADGSYSLIL